MIDLESLRRSPVSREPFTYFMAPGVLHPEDLSQIRADFPDIHGTGLYPLHELTYGPAFARLIDDIRSPELEQVMSEKLGVELTGKPLMITVRGHCHRKDGRIHTDSKDKVATVLLYLNEQWTPEAASSGCLRLLRNGNDLEDALCEIPPHGGTLVAFRRSENSWHGHHPFEGPRRYVMFNWLASGAALAKNVGRHTLSAALKRLGSRALGGGA